MAKYVVGNLKKLTNIFTSIRQEMEANPEKTINLSWEFSYRSKTLAQLGYFFGGICEAIQKHFKEIYGEEYSKDIIKELLYAECGEKEEIITPNGTTLELTKRISRMNVEEMCLFIEKVLDFCEEYEIKLQPELRFLWIYNLNPKHIEEVEQTKYRDKDVSYLNYVRQQPCIICGEYHSEAHHLKDRELAGLGDKTPDYMAISLCAGCHRNLNGNDSHITTDKVIKYAGFLFKKLTPKQFCKLCYDRFINHR